MDNDNPNYAVETLNALLNNEPAEAVDHFQALIKQRAQDMVYDRFAPEPFVEESVEEPVTDEVEEVTE
jgi:hypothetical protein